MQLDKFTPEHIQQVIAARTKVAPHCLISMAGGVNKHNIAEFTQTGIDFIVTSAPYYAMPEDIKVILMPLK